MKKYYPNMKAGKKLYLHWKKDCLQAICCDCLLVHKFVFEVKGDVMSVQGYRIDRKTNKLREKYIKIILRK